MADTSRNGRQLIQFLIDVCALVLGWLFFKTLPNAPDQKRASILAKKLSLAPGFWIWLLDAPLQQSIATTYRKLPHAKRWMPVIAALDRPGQARLSSARFSLQRLDQHQHFGGFFVEQTRILREGAVAAAGGDRLEGFEEGENAGGARIGFELLE
jgi:hypothetical protein